MRFPRTARLRKRREYLRIQGRRRGKKTPHFVVLSVPSDDEGSRLGVTVSRRVGVAVARNRVKRRVREFFRLHRNELQPPSDIVIVARAGADTLSFKDVESELSAVFGIGGHSHDADH